ncbi:MAG: hypothetical protein LBH50_02365 [Spirochaetaceae bacterium]|nr:hypothetical protein [Spirochaetaceae bacterium]
MNFQTIAVIAISAAALAALVLYIVRIFKRKGGCCCEGGAKCPHCKN